MAGNLRDDDLVDLGKELLIGLEPPPHGQGERDDKLAMGTKGRTLSTKCAAASAMRFPAQEGQKPLFLQEKAAICSLAHEPQASRL